MYGYWSFKNAYGRQLGSFETILEFKNLKKIEAVCVYKIAQILSVGENVEILSVCDDKIVFQERKNILVTAFHPELTNDYSVHKYFINMVKENIDGN